MRDEIARASAFLVRLRIRRVPRLKILGAAAIAKPIVSIRLGAEGHGFIDGLEILLTDEPTIFATKIARLLTDRTLCEELGREARYRVEKQYNILVFRSPYSRALAGVGL